MKYLIFAIADAAFDNLINAYVKDCDMNARDGRGSVQFTHDEKEAKQFDSIQELFDYWKQQSTIAPIRPDGKPNRPLTAFSIEIKKMEE